MRKEYHVIYHGARERRFWLRVKIVLVLTALLIGFMICAAVFHIFQ